MENNFQCPKTGKEYFIPKYKFSATAAGIVYKYEDGSSIVSEEGEVLIPIDRKKGFTTTVYGDTTSQIQGREKFFRERAKKHANSFDAKDEKAHRTKQELNNYTKKSNGDL